MRNQLKINIQKIIVILFLLIISNKAFSQFAHMIFISGQPSITGTTPGTRCDAGTLTLGAIATSGIINWYDAPTGGTSLATGTSFTTPSISATTTYYVDASFTGCTAASRTAVTALITNTAPTTQASNIIFTNLQSNQVTLSWTNGNGMSRIVICNTSNSFTNPVDGTDPAANSVYGGSGEQVVYNGSGNSVSVTGLTLSTTYYFIVFEANCNSTNIKFNVSNATNNPNQATTVCIVSSFPYTQNFDGAWTIPGTITGCPWSCPDATNNEWHRSDFQGGWSNLTGAYTPAGASSTTFSARFHSYMAANATTGTLISPAFDFSGVSGSKTLQFYYVNTDGTDAVDVYLSTDGGSIWGSSLQHLVTAAAWTQYTVNLGTTTSANAKIKFVAVSDYGNTDIGIDEVMISSSSCVTPTTQASNITFSNVIHNALTASWTNGNGTNRIVKMNTANSFTNPVDGTDPAANSVYGGSGEQVVYNGSGSSVAITGLSSSTTYYFKVFEASCNSTNIKFNVNNATNNPLSQATTVTPTTAWTETFETANSLTLVNAAANVWFRGTAAQNTGSYGLYITNDGGATNGYIITTTYTSHAYKDIVIPAGATNITLGFAWKCNGENNYDRLLIYSAPTTVTPVAGTPASNSTILTGATLIGTYNTQTTWQAVSNLNINNSYAGSTVRVIFTWQNDNSGGTTPPAAVDDISLNYFPSCTPPSAPTAVTPSTSVLICSGGSTNLNATSAGNTINWYTAATGGTFVGSSNSGANFSVSPGSNTTYYAEAQVSVGCVSATRTATALITVNTDPSISAQPLNAIICAGGVYSPSVTVTGGVNVTYQWQCNSGSWNNVVNGTPAGTTYSNQTTATLTALGWLGTGGFQYRCIISDAGIGCTTPLTSSISMVSVNPDPVISVQPSNATICAGGIYSPSVTVIGGVAITYQWQYNSGTWNNVVNGTPAGSVYTNATAPTLTATGITATGAHQYRCIVSDFGNGCTSPITSSTGSATVNPDPSISVQPSNGTICAGGVYSPSVTVTGGVSLTYQWQYSDGGAFTNVVNGTPTGSTYTNSTTSTLSISGISLAGGTNYYKCVITDGGSGCTSPLASNSASITVNPTPVAPTLSSAIPANGSTICAGFNTGTVTGIGGSGGGTGAANEYQVSTNSGSTWAAYTNGATITTTGATGNVIVQSRRTGGTECTTTAWTTICTWTVGSGSTAPTSINASTNPICAGDSTNLSVVGGSLGTGAAWKWGYNACGAVFQQDWNTQPYGLVSTTQNAVNGILNVTSTTNDAMIDMTALGSFDPAVYKYVQVRYRVVSGTAGTTEIYFYNTAHGVAVGGESAAGTLISDGAWHTLSINMWSDPEYTTGGNITGWRFDWCSASGVTMEIDNISLSMDQGSSITVSPDSNQTYYVYADGLCNTTACVNNTVIVNPIPTITSTTPGSNCGPGSLTLNATASAGTITWWDAPSGGTNLGTGTSFTTPSISATTTYYIDATSNGCTTASRTAIIATINPLPVITSENKTDVSICGGSDGTITIVATGDPTLEYSIDGGTTFVANGGIFNGLNNGGYPVVVKSGNGCIVNGSTLVIIDGGAPPAPVAGTDAIYCEGTVVSDLSASAGSGGSLTWYSNPGLTTITGTGTSFNPNGYVTVGTNAFYVTETVTGCQSPATVVTITVSSVDTTFQSQTICEGNNYDFFGTPLTNAGIYYHTLVSSLSCDSIIKLSLIVNLIDTTMQSQTICEGNIYNFFGTPINSTGIYYHTLVSSLSCDSVIKLSLIVNPVDTTLQSQTICEGNNYDFFGTPLNSAGIYYHTLVSSLSCDSVIRLSLIVNPVDTSLQSQTICEGTTLDFYGTLLTNAGTYFHTLISGLSCDSVIALTLSINPSPVVSFTGLPATVCAINQYFMLIGSHVPYGTFAGQGLLSNGFNPSSLSAGSYYISYSYTDSLGCFGADSLSVVINPLPGMQLLSSGQTTCGNANGNVTVDGTNGTAPYTFNWSTGATNPTISNLTTGSYIVTISDSNGCSGVFTENISSSDGPVITINSITNSSCNFSSDGTADITVTGGAEPYTYQWTNGETTEDALHLAEGTNSVTVTDFNNCNSVTSVNTMSTFGTPVIFGRISYYGGYVDGQYATLKIFSLINNNNGGYDTTSNEAAIGSDGSYVLYNFEPGQYILKVLLHSHPYTNLLNSYYTTFAASTHKWQEATPVILACGQDVEADIFMFQHINQGTGNGHISGTLVVNNSGSKTTGIHINLNKLSGNPVTGGEIYIELEPDDEPIANTETDTAGFYLFEQLPDGEYSLRVEIPGFPMISTYTVNITPTDSIFPDLDFIVDYTPDSGFVDTALVYLNKEKNEFVTISVFPNPFSNDLNVNYHINTAKEISIEVFDVAGKLIETTGKIMREEGSYLFVLQTEKRGLLSGTYFVQLRVGYTVYLKKVVKFD